MLGGGCYQGLLSAFQATTSAHGAGSRSILNGARNGDDTSRALSRLPDILDWIQRFRRAPNPTPPFSGSGSAFSTSPGKNGDLFLIIGLSLANQGWNEQTFLSGMTEIVRQTRAANVTAIVGGAYANGYKNPAQYAMTKRVNLLLQQRDAPFVSFMGAIDDGQGGWANGYWRDGGHPNDLGQTEMYVSVRVRVR